MNPRFITVLFTIIDLLHDATLVEWNDFVSGNIDYYLSDFSKADKLELSHALMKLNPKMGTHQWHRRFGVVKKIHELI